MEAQPKDYILDEMCRVLAVSESGYRAWKQGGTPDCTRLTDAQMLCADPRHSRRTQGRLRQPENDQGVAWTWGPGQQGTD